MQVGDVLALVRQDLRSPPNTPNLLTVLSCGLNELVTTEQDELVTPAGHRASTSAATSSIASMQNNDNPVMQNMTGLSTLNLVSFFCATLNLVGEHAALGIDTRVTHVEFGTDSYNYTYIFR
jgi:hypothetical protein